MRYRDSDELLSPARRARARRYATLGFSDEANLDGPAMWPTCRRHDGQPMNATVGP